MILDSFNIEKDQCVGFGPNALAGNKFIATLTQLLRTQPHKEYQ